MKKITTTLLAIASIFYLSAQEQESNIEEVRVKGKFLELPVNKINENITVISKAEIAASPAKSVEELLATYTGFDIRRRGGNGVQADVSLRGSYFEQVLILVNGIRINDSQTGHNSMSLPFDLTSVEKVEIIKGPAARRLGQNAYAGVVNIITKTGAEDVLAVSGSGGDFETYNIGLGAHFGNENFTNFFQANTTSSEGYRHNTDYKINNIFYQNEYKLADAKLKFQAGFQEKKFGANGFYASPNATEQYEETQASLVSLAFEQNISQVNINSNVYWRRGQDLYLFNREKPEIYRNMHIGNNIGAEVNASAASTWGVTGLGIELRKEFLASNNLGARERFLTQVFFEHHFSFFQEKLQISPGISWANYNTVGDFFYPGLDVGFDFNENHKIYGNIAKVNRIPTFTDLYYVSKTEQGNPDLNPENALSTEIGYRFQKNNFLAKMSYFTRNSENSIDWVKQNSADIWRAENIGDINTQGLEVEVNQRLNSFISSYSLGYTYLDSKAFEPQNLISRYVLENLKHQFVAKLENRLFANLKNQLIYRYNERVTTGSYQLLDEKITYDFKNLNLYLLINNLTNTKYTETFGVPMPGRWFHIGFTYKIGI